MILAGDIGGTNTRLALFEGTPDQLKPLEIEVFPSPQFSGPAEICSEISGQARQSCSRRGLFRTTWRGGGWPRGNHQSALGSGRAQVERPTCPFVGRVELINDLFANAHGIALLKESDFVVLNAGTASPTGNRALISAGTGLGEAGFFVDEAGGGFRPFPSEGGHCDFAPTQSA